MPPQFLFDISGIDLDKVLYGPEEIRALNMQRGLFEMLQAVVYFDAGLGRCVGYKDIAEDEFWVPGHIPGRPLFPGVMMIELAAQLAGFYTKKALNWEGFIGFGGVEETKFRQQVPPGVRMYVLAEQIYLRHRRIACKTQGMVNGTMVFEATIIGTQM